VVYTYENGTYESTEANEPAEEQTRFPNAISSDMVDENGAYYLAYLASGSYDLVVVSLSGEFIGVLGVIENIPVVSKETTNRDINIEGL
jgi:hypothetical protein